MNDDQARTLFRIFSIVYNIREEIQKTLPDIMLKAIQAQAAADIEAMRRLFPLEGEFVNELMRRIGILLEPFVPGAAKPDNSAQKAKRMARAEIKPLSAAEFMKLLETVEGDSDKKAAVRLVALDMLNSGFMAKVVPDAKTCLASLIAPELAGLERKRQFLNVQGLDAIDGRLSTVRQLLVDERVTMADVALCETQMIVRSYRFRCAGYLDGSIRSDLNDWTQGVLQRLFEEQHDETELRKTFVELAAAIMADARQRFCPAARG